MLPAKNPRIDISQDSWQRLEGFYRTFCGNERGGYAYDHLLFACQASFAVLLSPRMANLLWLNFNTYHFNGKPRKIDPVVVTDLLLSPLVRQAGNRQFEIIPDIRNYLLHLLSDGRWLAASGIDLNGRDTLKELAYFLMQYFADSRSVSDHPSPELRRLNLWAAKAYLQPDQLAFEIAAAFQQTFTPGGEATDEFEQLQLSMWIDRFHTQLELDITSATRDNRRVFTNLQRYSQGTRALLFGESASNYFYGLDDRFLKDSNAAVQIKLPIVKEIGERLERKRQRVRRVFMLLIDAGETKELPTLNTSADVLELDRAMGLLTSGVKVEKSVILSGAEASRSKILSEIENLYQNALDEDSILIYFAGRSTVRQQETALFPYDAGVNDPPSLIAANELSAFIERCKGTKQCATIVMLDTAFGAGQNFGVSNLIHIGLPNTREGKLYKTPRNTPGFGHLIAEIIQKTDAYITYRELIFLLRVFAQRDRHDQLPIMTVRGVLPDAPIFGQERKVIPMGTYFISYSTRYRKWRVFHEHFRQVPIFQPTQLLYVDGSPVKKGYEFLKLENGLVTFDDDRQQLDTRKLYRIWPERTKLRLQLDNVPNVMREHLQQEMEAVSLDNYSPWSGVAVPGMATQPSDDFLSVNVPLTTDGQTGKLQITYHDSRAAEISWSVTTGELRLSLQRFARYVYLTDIKRADEYNIPMRPIVIDIRCDWGKQVRSPKTSVHEQFISLDALLIEGSRIQVKPLVLSLRSQEENDIYVEAYLLTPGLGIINLAPGLHHYLAPRSELVIEYGNSELFLKCLRDSAELKLQILYSRDPIWEDLTQEAYGKLV